MKRIFVLILSLVTLFSVSALTYTSNALGQKIRLVQAVPATGYAVDADGNTEVLYLDGKAVRKTVRVKNGDDIIETETDLAGGKTVTRVYSKGLLTTESDSDGNVTNYGYVDGHLAFCSRGTDDQVSEMTFFLRSSSDGSLMAVKEGETVRFVSESYIFQNDELLQQIAADLVISEDYEVLDDGSIRYQKAGAEYVYSPSGLLMSVSQDGAFSEYYYENKTLVRIETTDGAVRSVENYRDGKAFEKLVYENEVLASLTEYRTEGNIQYLYRNGRKIATVYYRQDNRTVDRIEYN